MSRAEKLAEQFHTIYEELAPSFSHKTRKASAVPWKDVPEQNKLLMIAVVEKAMLPKIERLLAQEREKVRERHINATCIMCRNRQEPRLQSFGGKNWEGRYQAWVHDVRLEGQNIVETCLADAIRQLDLTNPDEGSQEKENERK